MRSDIARPDPITYISLRDGYLREPEMEDTSLRGPRRRYLNMQKERQESRKRCQFIV